MPGGVAQVDFFTCRGVGDHDHGPGTQPDLEDGTELARPAGVGLDLSQPLELQGVPHEGRRSRARDVAEAEAGQGVEGPEEELVGWVVGVGEKKERVRERRKRVDGRE